MKIDIKNLKKNFMFFFGNSPAEIFVRFTMSGVNAVITDHFKMFLGDMDNELFDEIPCGNSLGNKFVIFVSVVMKSDEITIIIVNTGRSNNRSAEIATNIVKNRFVVG